MSLRSLRPFDEGAASQIASPGPPFISLPFPPGFCADAAHPAERQHAHSPAIQPYSSYLVISNNISLLHHLPVISVRHLHHPIRIQIQIPRYMLFIGFSPSVATLPTNKKPTIIVTS